MANSTITEAAHTIAGVVNGWRSQGSGFCVFRVDGSGGEWYSTGAVPTLSEDEIAVDVTWWGITPARAQRLLDQHAGHLDAADRDDPDAAAITERMGL
jgi:hypothetical protein